MLTAGAVSANRTRATEGVPLLITGLAFLAILSSCVVMVEPAPTDLVFALLIGVTLLMGPAALRFQGIGLAILLGLVVFTVGTLASMLLVVSASESVRYAAITFFLVAMFMTLAGLIGRYGPRFADFCLRTFCLAALFTSVVGILARFGLVPNAEMFFRDEHALRIRGTFKDPNVFAPFVVGAMLIVINDYVTRRRSAVSTAAYSIVYLLAVLFAFSRGAFANLLLALVLYGAACLFLVRDRAISRRIVVAMAVGGVLGICALVYAIALSGMGDFLDERLSMQGYDDHRFATQSFALGFAAEYPLGIGPGQWRAWHPMDPHNVYLFILCENGVLGLLGFLVWTAGCVLKGIGGIVRRSPHAPVYAACVAVILGILGESIIIDTLHWRHLFFFLAIPVGLRIYDAAQPRPEAAGT